MSSLLSRGGVTASTVARMALFRTHPGAAASAGLTKRQAHQGAGGGSQGRDPAAAGGGIIFGGILLGLGGLGALAYAKKNQMTLPFFAPKSPSDRQGGESESAAAPAPYTSVRSVSSSVSPSGEVQATDLKKDAVPDLPKHVGYLLVGAGTASFAAYRAIRSRDPRAKILIVGEEERLPYMRPPLSKEMWYGEVTPEGSSKADVRFKQWNGRERSVFFEHPSFYTPHADLPGSEKGGISVVTGRKVVRIDASKREAHLDNGSVVSYDKCLVATGGKPKALPVLDRNPVLRSKVTLFRKIEDYYRLEELVRHSGKIAIVGGGFLGSELACALAHNKKRKNEKLEIYQIFPEAGNMAKVLPDYLSEWTTSKVTAEGVKVLTGTSISDALVTDRGKMRLMLKGGKETSLEVDHVVVAVGIEPNTELARESRLEVDDRLKGFRVNSELEARSNLWVAGDAASFYDPVLGRRRVEHHDHAVVSGRLAGENMTGAGRPYTHQSMFWSDLGPEVGYEAIGLVDSSLQTVGVFAKASKKDSPKVASEQSGEAMRSDAEEEAAQKQEAASAKASSAAASASTSEKDEKYGKGVIFYLNGENRVVGLLLWNVFSRMGLARKIIRENRTYEDLAELAKLFNIHDEELVPKEQPE